VRHLAFPVFEMRRLTGFALQRPLDYFNGLGMQRLRRARSEVAEWYFTDCFGVFLFLLSVRYISREIITALRDCFSSSFELI
jgi:hypothetical protein